MIKKIAKILLVSILCVMVLLITSANYLQDSFGKVEFATVVYQLNSSLEGTNSEVIVQYIEQALVPAFFGILLILFLLFGFGKIVKRLPIQVDMDFFGLRGRYCFGNRLERYALLLGCSLFIIVIFTLKAREVGIIEYIRDITDVSLVFEENYVEPDKVELVFPKQKKNLIYIYLESMETTYASTEEGGGKKVNYIPNLTKVAKDNISFSQGEQMNGLFQTSGAGWTMGALLASTSGVPYLMPIDGNSSGDYDTILPGLTTLGEILKKEGYDNYFMCGSESVFGGRKAYFEQHGDYKIYDYDTAVEEAFIPADYWEFWGIEDKKLYEYAKEKLTEIANEDESFNFTMLTVDTHHPEGYVCELCGSEFGEQYANVIRCADAQIAEFLEWLEKQSWYASTVVVIQGDHTSMSNVFWEDLPENYERGIYNCFMNTDKVPESEHRVATTLDMFPTTLAAIGVEIEGERLGLGTNLFSGIPTLAEKFEKNIFSDETAKYSRYYYDNFIKTAR